MTLKRVAIFIDGSNLYHALLKNFGRADIDFFAFANFLAGTNSLAKVYYYNSPLNQKEKPEEYRRQQKFFASLSKIPKFEINLGRLEKRPKGQPVEKGVDVKLAVDMLRLAYSNAYEIAILVSGDADFVLAIKAAQDFGKETINVAFPKTKSFHLNQVCKKTILIRKETAEKLFRKINI